MERKTLLKTPWYRVLCTIITVLTFWVGADLLGRARILAEPNTEMARNYMTPSAATDACMALMTKAKSDADYTPDNWSRDRALLAKHTSRSGLNNFHTYDDELRERMFACARVKYKEEIAAVVGGHPELRSPENALHEILRSQMMAAHEAHGLPGLDWKDFGKSLGSIVLLLIFFSFGALPILLLRIATSVATFAQWKYRVRTDLTEVLTDSFFWMFGLSEHGYDPNKNWDQRMRELATVPDPTFRDVTTALQYRATSVHEGIMATCAAIWQQVWAGLSWKAAVSSLRTREGRTIVRRKLATASYLSIVATVYLTVGYAKAYAAEAEATKEPTWLGGINIVDAFDPRAPQATNGTSIFFFGRDGTTLVALGIGGLTPLYEVTHNTTHARVGRWFFDGGPFADLQTDGSTSFFGVTGFGGYTSGKLTWAGPIYLAAGRDGSKSIWMPGSFALYQVSEKLRLGVGYSFFAGNRQEPSLTVGPLVEYAITQMTRLRARYTNGGTGTFKGTGPRLRLDLIHSFK